MLANTASTCPSQIAVCNRSKSDYQRSVGTQRRAAIHLSFQYELFPNEYLNCFCAASRLELVASRIRCRVESSVCRNQRLELWAVLLAEVCRITQILRGTFMTIKIRVALVVTLAVCVAPVAVAHPRTHHAQTSHSGATYGSAYLYWQERPMASRPQLCGHHYPQAMFPTGAGRA